MSREKRSPNRFAIVVIIINLMLIVSLVRNAWGLYQARSWRDRVEDEVSILEEQKRQMEWQAKAQTDPAALDLIIRNKLNLSKNGETVVVIAGRDEDDASASATTQEEAYRSNLQKWWKVINP